jgi:hypothetical protein
MEDHMETKITVDQIKDGDYLKVWEPGCDKYWVGDIMVRTHADGDRVVYNPNCCSACKTGFGCIMTLDECLAFCYVEVIDTL